jgi:hypothetical protein
LVENYPKPSEHIFHPYSLPSKTVIMAKIITRWQGKLGLTAALVCLYLSGAAQNHEGPAKAGTIPQYASTKSADAAKAVSFVLPVVDIRGKVIDEHFGSWGNRRIESLHVDDDQCFD